MIHVNFIGGWERLPNFLEAKAIQGFKLAHFLHAEHASWMFPTCACERADIA
jgi:hypothetical protein